MIHRLAAALIIGSAAMVAAARADAGFGDSAAIAAIQGLRTVDSVEVIDTEAFADNGVGGRRAQQPFVPATPLQAAIAGNPALMDAIRRSASRAFDLRSVYAARVDGYSVYLYMAEPPL